MILFNLFTILIKPVKLTQMFVVQKPCVPVISRVKRQRGRNKEKTKAIGPKKSNINDSQFKIKIIILYTV